MTSYGRIIALLMLISVIVIGVIQVSVLYHHSVHNISLDLKSQPGLFVKNASTTPDITELRVQIVHSFAPVHDPYIAQHLFVKPEWERKYFIFDCSRYTARVGLIARLWQGLISLAGVTDALGGLCGGFADRQEGIVAAYIISQILRRKFRIKMNIPCDIANHLQPHSHNWIFNPFEVKGLSHTHYRKLDGNAWTLREKIANGLDLEKEFPYDVTYFTANQEMVNYLQKHPSFVNLKWAHNQTAADIYNIVLRRLFQMTPTLLQRFTVYQNTARNKGRNLVCAQIRLRGNPTLPNDDYVSLPNYRLNITVVWNFLAQYNNSDRFRIFVASDSDKVRQDAKHLFPDVLQDVPGNIVHVDRDTHSREYACKGFAKVILDQQTMATCDVLFLTDSGLGRIASMLRGTDDGLFCMIKNSQGNTDYKRCHFSDKTFFPPYW